MLNSQIDITKLSDEEKYEFIMQGVNDLAEHLPNEEEKSDAIIVLGASPKALYSRISKALELYALGYSDKIIITGARGFALPRLEHRKQEFIHILEEIFASSDNTMSGEELYNLTEAELGAKMIYELPEMREITDDLSSRDDVFTETKACTTFGNAYNSKLILEANGVDVNKLLLVTSGYHGKRAKASFKKQLPDVDIIVAPTTIDLNIDGFESFEETKYDPEYKKHYHNETDAMINYTKKNLLLDEEANITFEYELEEPINDIELDEMDVIYEDER